MPPRREPAPPTTETRRSLYAYFNDDWHITRTLTLNLGVRYEYTGVPLGRVAAESEHCRQRARTYLVRLSQVAEA